MEDLQVVTEKKQAERNPMMKKEYERRFEPGTVVQDWRRGFGKYGSEENLYRIAGETEGKDGTVVRFIPLFGEAKGQVLEEPRGLFYSEYSPETCPDAKGNPKYRYEIFREIEIGNLLFGHSRGAYPLQRGALQDAFAQFLLMLNSDGYGYYEGGIPNLKANGRGGAENETFLVNPYYWGEDDDEAEKPNFVFKPDGLEIRWYKYPMRDAYSNEEISLERMKDVIDACLESVKKGRSEA